MTRPVIISCAVTGGADNAHMNPAIPVTPEQIASEVLAARGAGAAIAHIHVRDPATGKPSRDLALYREVVARVRDAGSDVVINLTTGPGARFVPDDRDQRWEPGNDVLWGRRRDGGPRRRTADIREPAPA